MCVHNMITSHIPCIFHRLTPHEQYTVGGFDKLRIYDPTDTSAQCLCPLYHKKRTYTYSGTTYDVINIMFEICIPPCEDEVFIEQLKWQLSCN